MGLLNPQKSGDKQVVIFTIECEISPADRDHWNNVVADLKAKFPEIKAATLAPHPPTA